MKFSVSPEKADAPELFTCDCSARLSYRLRDDIRLQDYVCDEKHRDISSVQRRQGH
jgi:hypothetical protein